MSASSNRWMWVIVAALAAAAVPAWLLWPPHERPAGSGGMIVAKPKPVGDPASLDSRQLFSSGDPREAAILPEGSPELVGIIGRPPHDAVVLVRVDGGGTKTLAPGQSHQGWKLDAVSGEAALFSRNARRIRVPISLDDPAESPEPQ